MRAAVLGVVLLLLPQAVQAQDVYALVEWDFTAPAVGFVLERQDGGLGAFTEIGSVAADARTYEDYTIIAGQSYCYRLRALTVGGDSPYSNILCGTATRPDTQAPTAQIVSPLPGGVPRKSWITVTVAVQDDDGMSHVEVFLNGSLLCVTMVQPFQCTFRTSAKPDKTYRIEARAYDLAGNRGEAAAVTVVTQ